jgi:hypothetical protein
MSDCAEFWPLVYETGMFDAGVDFYTLLYNGENSASPAVWKVYFKDHAQNPLIHPFSADGANEWSVNQVLRTNYIQAKIQERQHVSLASLPMDEKTESDIIQGYFNSKGITDTAMQKMLVQLIEDPPKIQFSYVDLEARKADGIASYILENDANKVWVVRHLNGEIQNHPFSSLDSDDWSINSVLRRLYTNGRLQRFVRRIKDQEARKLTRKSFQTQMLEDIVDRCVRLLAACDLRMCPVIMVCSVAAYVQHVLLRGVGPHSHPQTESSGVVWGGTLPTCADCRVGCPRLLRGLSRHRITEGLVETPDH